MTGLCGLCDEVLEDYEYHPGCCPHDEVTVDDGRDGHRGRVRAFCDQCGDEVRLMPPEDPDDGPYWEAI